MHIHCSLHQTAFLLIPSVNQNSERCGPYTTVWFVDGCVCFLLSELIIGFMQSKIKTKHINRFLRALIHFLYAVAITDEEEEFLTILLSPTDNCFVPRLF